MSDVNEAQNTQLQARVAYLTNVNQKLRVMIKNAADVLDQFACNIELILVELRKTQEVYSKLHNDLEEVFGDSSNNTTGT